MEAKIIDKLAWIHIKDRKVLMVRSYGKDAFYSPGGGREEGESDVEALLREVKEELTVDLKPESLKPYGVFSAPAHGRPKGTLVRMTCYTANYSGELSPDSEIEEMIWFTSKDRARITDVGQLIFDHLVGNNEID